ncbi:MAG TPA: adenylate/guanylate cyclase domain-containing protein, partial [Leptospiraceae bacterium]|nr:adenylate/guanylate cyclase domain-containing protein [Leptospiraceae bacterium]
VARIDVPLNLFGNARSEPLRLLRQNKELLAITWNLFQQIDLSAVRFDLDGHILAVSRSMLKRLAIPLETPDMFKTLVPQRFVAELFRGPQGIRVTQKFLNHRVYLENLSRTERILFNVSGYVTDKGVVSTLWQEIAISDSAAPKLNEGSLIGNLKFHNIIEPYIPQLVLMKARETVELGRTELPEEVRDQTIFFADLAGFTEMSESMRPHVVVEMLNMALSIMVRHIKEAGGSVDKFMGDAVMAVFADPLPACKAALEIQNTFAEVNRFRIEAKEPPVRARIGIHCGNVIMANIGTDERKDWTAIGDTVNTASRIEKNAPVGSILISDRVFERVKDDLRVTQSYRIKVKGKAKEISVYELEAMNSAPADS